MGLHREDEPGVSIEVAEDAVEPILDTLEAIFTDDHGEQHSETHSDDEGSMTKEKLFSMGKMAQSFHDRLKDGDDLPGWVQDKVTTAEDRLRSAYEYMDYKLHRMKTQGSPCNERIVRSMTRDYLRSVL
jgi:hypothetical protein